MKKRLLLSALLVTGAAHAQDNVLKLDILQPTINTLALSYEHKLSESSSFQIGVSGTFGYEEEDGFFNSSSSRKTSGFAITPEYRLYLSEKHAALEGFYVAPFVRLEYLNQTGDYNNGMGNNPAYEASLSSFGLGATVGRHWIFKQRFSLDVFFGPGYTFASVDSNVPEVNKGDFVGYFDNTNYNFRGGLTFGLAF